MDLCIIAEGTDIVGEIQQQGAFDFIRAKVRKLSIHAGEGLRLHVVLLQRYADSVIKLDPPLLAGIRMPPIILGAPNFAKAQFPRFEADKFGHILTRWGARRLEIA